MRGPFAVLLATTILVGTVFSNEAYAQKKRVVVEMFNKGPNPAKVRAAVIRGLLKNGIEVVPDKRIAALEADLGLIKVSDSYAAVARETKAVAFIGGVVTPGRRAKARVVVRSAEGKTLGAQSWQGNIRKVLAQVNATGGARLAGIIKSSAGAAPAVARESADSDPLGAVATRRPAAKEEEAAPAEEPADKKGEEPAGEETPETAGADAEVADAADDEEPTARKKAGRTGLNVAFVLRMFSRNFKYNESKRGGQQGYQAPEEKFNGMPIVPMPGLALEYFPTSMVGVFGSYNRAIVGSKDSEGSVYKTSAYSWLVGAKGRIGVSSLEIEPSIGYGSHVFQVNNFVADPQRIQVAGVDYRHVRIGSDVRLPFSGGASFVAGGHYLYIMSAGDILNADKFFKGNALGGEGSAGVVFPLSFYKGLEGRVSADFRQVVFKFDPTTADARIAGGATDRYIGINLGLGYNLNI